MQAVRQMGESRENTMKKPNAVQTVLSVASCKATRAVLRKTGRGGTALPGLVAMRAAKNILAKVSDGMQIVVVTGTNGKTTSCNMIEHALTYGGHDCLRDKSGANMLHGIAADLISESDWRGNARHPYAVLECDEAALKLLVQYIEPRAIVVTNLFSDQVDRYGGVQNTLEEIRAGIKGSPKSVLVLNAEDPLSASLAQNVPNRIIWYGLEKSVGVQGNVDLSDAGVCPVCGSEYTYDYHIYAQLGGFRCPKCGYSRQMPDVAVLSIDKKDTSGSTIRLETDGVTQEVHVALPAVYNVYNAAGTVAAVKALGLPAQEAIDSLSSVRSAFGRLETFDLDGIRLQMILVKNPAGCNQAFSYVTGFDQDFSAVLCLNNRTGDGHDISWIETTDYEKLVADPHLKKIYVGGDCADQLWARLEKAAGKEHSAAADTADAADYIDAADGMNAADHLNMKNRMERITDYRRLPDLLKADGRPVFILPNYTAMMELRQVLTPATGNKEFWE